MSKCDSLDIAAALQREIIANPDSSDARKDTAAMRLVNISRLRTIQRRDVRVRRLQDKLDKALARITELESQLIAAAPKQFTSLREMAAQSQ